MHIPVLTDEIVEFLIPEGKPVNRAIDGTLGAGGHTRALLEAGVERVLAFDLDSQAIRLAQASLSDYTDRVQFIHDSYIQMSEYALKIGWDHVDAILLDFGLSSMQLDTPERGFAFQFDAPLDMRFNPDGHQASAADVVNLWDADELADIFFRYGEERHSRKIARAIVAQRPLHTTRQLADVIVRAVPAAKKQNIHPATRTFQALRIAVNDELKAVETVLPLAIDLLCPGGRLAAISFHSLEDRIVKRIFKSASEAISAPPGMASIEEKVAQVKVLTRKPITPSDEEITRNPRSRSSKLRVVEKIN